jgi:hypothetical protein
MNMRRIVLFILFIAFGSFNKAMAQGDEVQLATQYLENGDEQ